MNPYRFFKIHQVVNAISVLIFLSILTLHFFPNLTNNLTAAELTKAGNIKAESNVSAKILAENRAQKDFSTTMDKTALALNGNFNLAVYDVTKDQTFTYLKGSENNWWMASTAKLSILTELLLTSGSDGSNFDENLTNEVQAMIRNSDNDATKTILKDNFPAESTPLQTLFKQFDMKDSISGMTADRDGWGLSRTTPLDQIKLLKNIFISSSILSKPQQAYIQNEMQNVNADQQWGISKFSGQIKTLAIKDGWGIQDNNNMLVDNSIGSVTLQNGHQYLIAAYGDGFTSDDEGIANQEKLIAAAGAILTK